LFVGSRRIGLDAPAVSERSEKTSFLPSARVGFGRFSREITTREYGQGDAFAGERRSMRRALRRFHLSSLADKLLLANAPAPGFAPLPPNSGGLAGLGLYGYATFNANSPAVSDKYGIGPIWGRKNCPPADRRGFSVSWPHGAGTGYIAEETRANPRQNGNVAWMQLADLSMFERCFRRLRLRRGPNLCKSRDRLE